MAGFYTFGEQAPLKSINYQGKSYFHNQSIAILGLKDYVRKNGFEKVVIGLSGGVDSSLVAALAADALGKENVTGVFMPTRHSSGESESYARKLAENLGLNFKFISIEQIYNMYLSVLEPHFCGCSRDSRP